MFGSNNGKRKMKLSFKNSDASAEQITAYKKLFFILVIAITLVTVLTSSVPFLSREQVDGMLTGFSEELSTYAQSSGSQASFTYGAVEVAGSGYQRRALVANPSLSVSRTLWFGPQTITLSAPNMVLLPDPSGTGSFIVEFPEPLTISERGIPSHTLSFPDGPGRYAVIPQGSGEDRQYLHTLILPPRFQLSSYNGGKLMVTYDAGPRAALRYTPSQLKSETSVAFRNLALVGQDSTVQIGSLSSAATRAPAEEGRIAFDTSLTLNDIAVKKGSELEGPYSFKLSAAGKRLGGAAGAANPESDVDVKELVLSADQFQLSAAGKMKRTADDSLPYGGLDVKVKHFSSLRNSNTLAPEIKLALVEMASRATGADASTADDLAFSVQREKLGSLMIGASRFEELAAIFISRALLGGAAPLLLPEGTPATGGEPPAQPIDTPEPSKEKPST